MTMKKILDGTQSGVANDSNLERMKAREQTLRQQSRQLQARAEHLERQRLKTQRHLHRRIDAHEKIVLGALVKKAGLDIVVEGRPSTNDDVMQSTRSLIVDKSTRYDREYILGAMLWLASALKQQRGDSVILPNRQSIVVEGRKALAKDDQD
jgi:hypothetical protein